MRIARARLPAAWAAMALLMGCSNEGRVVDVTPASATQVSAALPAVTTSPAPAPGAREGGGDPRSGGAGPRGSRDMSAIAAVSRPHGESIPGLLVADRKAAIGSQLTGQVEAVLVREGDRVRAG